MSPLPLTVGLLFWGICDQWVVDGEVCGTLAFSDEVRSLFDRIEFHTLKKSTADDNLALINTIEPFLIFPYQPHIFENIMLIPVLVCVHHRF